MAAPIYDTPEALAKLSEPDAEFAELLATTPQHPHLDFTHPIILAIRQNQLAAASAHTETLSSGENNEETLKIPMRDGHSSELRIHHPPPATSPSPSPSPLILLFHGGGFIFGNNQQPASTARRLASLYNATVVCPAYRLAPEHPWPKAHEDAWDTLVWVVQHATSSSPPDCLRNVSLETGFVLAGSSAGGNIAAVLVGKYLSKPPTLSSLTGDAAAAPPPNLTGLWIDSSMLFHSLPYVPAPYRDLHLSHEQNADAPGLLSKQAVGYIREAVRGDGGSSDFSPVNSPYFTSSESTGDKAGSGKEGRSWPRTFIQVAGMDPFRDDGIVFARMLGDLGTEVKLKVYEGVPHGFASLWPGLRVAERARREGVEGVRWLLGREGGG